MTPRILLLAALAAMTIVATSAAAEQPRPAQAKAEPKRDASRPAPKPAAKPAPKGDARYGHWDKSWGTRPPAPPQHFGKEGDWYRHVRACQRAYRSYHARTDSYRGRDGRTLRCRL
jgi:hypothetical protein